MNQFKSFKKDQKGMTLVEIMTGFAIIAIVMAISLSVMLFSSNVLSTDGSRDRLKMLGDEMYEVIKQKLVFATHIELAPNGSDPDNVKYSNVIFTENGKLMHGPKGGPYEEYYSNDVYQDTELVIVAAPESDSVLAMELYFYRQGSDDSSYETKSSFNLLNIASQTDDVQIEGNRQINPIISYDEIPYEIIENYDPSGSGGSDGAFTVSKYPEEYKDKIKEWELNTYYYPGDIVYFEGEYWQAVRTIYTGKGDKNKEPGHPHSFLWKSLNEDWEAVNKGGSEKSTYEKYDVVVYNGKYYMSRIDFNSLSVTTIAAWIEVYWWNDKDEPEDRRLGWSYTPKDSAEGYVSIYELWWGI